jgi:hypothetical protein
MWRRCSSSRKDWPRKCVYAKHTKFGFELRTAPSSISYVRVLGVDITLLCLLNLEVFVFAEFQTKQISHGASRYNFVNLPTGVGGADGAARGRIACKGRGFLFVFTRRTGTSQLRCVNFLARRTYPCHNDFSST